MVYRCYFDRFPWRKELYYNILSKIITARKYRLRNLPLIILKKKIVKFLNVFEKLYVMIQKENQLLRYKLFLCRILVEVIYYFNYGNTC